MSSPEENEVDHAPLTAVDDAFHLPESHNPWWTETVWYQFLVPERHMVGNFYAFFRPNLGVYGGGMWIYDDTGKYPWEIPFHSYQWELPIPFGLDLRDGKFGDGMWLRCVEPTKVYEFGYDNHGLKLDAKFEAIQPAMLTRPRPKPPFKAASHVDGPGRVTGHMNLRGETFDIDCLSMRDRSWGLRTDLKGVKAGYDQSVASEKENWLVFSMGTDDDDYNYRVVMGYLVRDGIYSKLKSGVRSVERNERGLLTRTHIEAEDQLGRKLSAHAEALNHYVAHSYPPMFQWTSFASWHWDNDQKGWGETQEVWTPDQWREFRRERLPGRR